MKTKEKVKSFVERGIFFGAPRLKVNRLRIDEGIGQVDSTELDCLVVARLLRTMPAKVKASTQVTGELLTRHQASFLSVRAIQMWQTDLERIKKLLLSGMEPM